MSSVDASLERVRQLWTPGNEIVPVEGELAPQTALDSVVRDLLHRAVQQKGPMTLRLDANGERLLNSGVLRWEAAGVPGYREVSLWIEEEVR